MAGFQVSHPSVPVALPRSLFLDDHPPAERHVLLCRGPMQMDLGESAGATGAQPHRQSAAKDEGFVKALPAYRMAIMDLDHSAEHARGDTTRRRKRGGAAAENFDGVECDGILHYPRRVQMRQHSARQTQNRCRPLLPEAGNALEPCGPAPVNSVKSVGSVGQLLVRFLHNGVERSQLLPEKRRLFLAILAILALLVQFRTVGGRAALTTSPAFPGKFSVRSTHCATDADLCSHVQLSPIGPLRVCARSALTFSVPIPVQAADNRGINLVVHATALRMVPCVRHVEPHLRNAPGTLC